MNLTLDQMKTAFKIKNALIELYLADDECKNMDLLIAYIYYRFPTCEFSTIDLKIMIMNMVGGFSL